jgi:hypothetical protein
MIASFDPGALLGASYRLADGTRVRLRMVAPSDRQRVRALVQACASCDDELVTERLLRFDPRTRAVVCATALIGGCETMVGVGAIDLTADGPRAPIPNPLLVAEFAPAGVADLLAGALLGRAGALARTRAA